ncbi:MAG: hypothetical protein R2684_14690 [Pyrinomonadaceae bacterium]
MVLFYFHQTGLFEVKQNDDGTTTFERTRISQDKNLGQVHVMRQEEDGNWSSKNGENALETGIRDPKAYYNKVFKDNNLVISIRHFQKPAVSVAVPLPKLLMCSKRRGLIVKSSRFKALNISTILGRVEDC